MEKTTLGLISIVFIISLGLGYSKLSQLGNDTRDLHTQLQTIQSRLGTLESQFIQRRSENQSILISKIRKAQETEQKASEQRGAYQPVDRDGNLDTADSQNTSLHDRIEQQKKTVDGLVETLRQVRLQISQAKKQRHQEQLTLQNEQKNINDQYSALISQTQQSIEQLQTQLDAAKQVYSTNQFDLQAAQSINDLRAQINTKTGTIQSLKEQRANDNIQKSSQRTSAISQAQQELDDLETNEQSVSDQLAHEREALLFLRTQENTAANPKNP